MGSVTRAEFREQAADVGLCSGWAHVQSLSDLGVGEPLGNLEEDLSFALGERIEQVGVDGVGFVAGGEVLDEAPGDGRGEKGLAGGYGPDGVEEFFGGCVFEQEAAGAGPKGGVDVFVEVEGGENATQIRDARSTAAEVSWLTIETKSSVPPGSEVIDLAAVFGIVLALAILAMSIGLIRSETTGELRTLTATGASSWTRRTISAATAGALGFLGAVLGTFTAYVGLVAFVRTNSLNGGESALLSTMPVNSLLEILVAMPIAAGVVAWLLAGRDATALTRQAIE